MTWSYNASLLLQGSAKDIVRLLIGDVVSTDQQMQDEEISYLASTRGTVYGAAAECCRSLANKYARSVDQQAGTSKTAYSQMSKAYAAAALRFENKAVLSGAALPYAGGISVSDKQLQDFNNDRVQPQFALGMTDNYLPEPSSGHETIEVFAGTGMPNP